MSVQSSLQATTSLVSQTKHLSNQFRKSCSVKASTTTSSSIDTNTFALHGKSWRKCMLTGKRANNGYTVSFSHIRNKKLQQANLQVRVRSRLCRQLGCAFVFRNDAIILLFFIHPRSGFLSRNLPQKLTSWNFSFYLPFNASYSTNAYTGRNKSDTFACAFPPKRLKL